MASAVRSSAPASPASSGPRSIVGISPAATGLARA